jgi:hypothetical protein
MPVAYVDKRLKKPNILKLTEARIANKRLLDEGVT